MKLSDLIADLRAHFAAGGNATQRARELRSSPDNEAFGILVAYDLQAGSYVGLTRASPAVHDQWCEQVTDCIRPFARENMSLLEVGCGECTTLQGVLSRLARYRPRAFAFDISWSRLASGKSWLAEHGIAAQLFVAELEHIPLADNSIDIVYSSHSLEPNGGREEFILAECLRVARRAVVLIEPMYELGSELQQQRMREHRYVRNLRQSAESLPCTITDHRLLPYVTNPLNPTGLLVLEKATEPASLGSSPKWRCPLSDTPLMSGDAFWAPDVGLVYPLLRGIPLLRREHAVIASAFSAMQQDTSKKVA